MKYDIISLTASLFILHCCRCPIIDAVKDLINGLGQQIKDTIRSPFDGTNVAFNIEKLTDPLMETIDDAITNFTDNIVGDLNVTDCSSDSTRRLQESTNTSLAAKIQSGIDSVNQNLGSLGITISGEVSPYFDGTTFAAGVTASLDVSFEQSAAGLIAIIGDFFEDATANAQKLGIASAEMPSTAPSMTLLPTYTFYPSAEPSTSTSPSLKPSISSQPTVSAQPSISFLPSVSLEPTPSPNVVSADFEKLLSEYTHGTKALYFVLLHPCFH